MFNKDYEDKFKCPGCNTEYEEKYAICNTCKHCEDCCACLNEDQELILIDKFLEQYDPFE